MKPRQCLTHRACADIVSILTGVAADWRGRRQQQFSHKCASQRYCIILLGQQDLVVLIFRCWLFLVLSCLVLWKADIWGRVRLQANFSHRVVYV